MDYYKILKVSRKATAEEIAKAFRTLAMECHPDRCTSNVKKPSSYKFIEIKKAFDTLRDPKLKEAYDLQIGNVSFGTWRTQSNSRSGPKQNSSKNNYESCVYQDPAFSSMPDLNEILRKEVEDRERAFKNFQQQMKLYERMAEGVQSNDIQFQYARENLREKRSRRRSMRNSRGNRMEDPIEVDCHVS